MGELLMRRREMIKPNEDAKPLYPLDGEYTTTGGFNGTTKVSNGHWVVEKKVASGHGRQTIYSWGDTSLLNSWKKYRVVVKNLKTLSGSPNIRLSMGRINSNNANTLRPDWQSGWACDLYQYNEGDGEWTFTWKSSQTTGLMLCVISNWSSPFSCEFDFELYADGVRWF